MSNYPEAKARMNCRKKEQGFTLLEVLAAMAVLAVGMLILLQTDALNASRTLHSSRLSGAVWLAQEKMDELFSRGVPDFPEDEQSDDPGVYRWRTSVNETEYEGVKEVRLTVIWQEGRREESYSVVAYLPE